MTNHHKPSERKCDKSSTRSAPPLLWVVRHCHFQPRWDPFDLHRDRSLGDSNGSLVQPPVPPGAILSGPRWPAAPPNRWAKLGLSCDQRWEQTEAKVGFNKRFNKRFNESNWEHGHTKWDGSNIVKSDALFLGFSQEGHPHQLEVQGTSGYIRVPGWTWLNWPIPKSESRGRRGRRGLMIVPIILRGRFRYIFLGEVSRCGPLCPNKKTPEFKKRIWEAETAWAIIALQHSKLRLVHEVILFTVARHLILSGLKAEQIRSEMLPWRHADSNQNQPVHWESAPNCTVSPFPLRKTWVLPNRMDLSIAVDISFICHALQSNRYSIKGSKSKGSTGVKPRKRVGWTTGSASAESCGHNVDDPWAMALARCMSTPKLPRASSGYVGAWNSKLTRRRACTMGPRTDVQKEPTWLGNLRKISVISLFSVEVFHSTNISTFLMKCGLLISLTAWACQWHRHGSENPKLDAGCQRGAN